MAYRILRAETLDRAARRIAADELDVAITSLGAGGDPHARVHDSRKAIKRVRALVRLVRAGLGANFGRDNLDLRDAARRLASRRDAVVAADAFARLVPEPTPELAVIGEVLAASRDEVLAHDDALAAAAADLTRVRARSADWPPLGRGWAVIRPGLRTSYARGRAAMRAAFAAPGPVAFHSWRKRVKDLWYHTLLLQNVWKPVQSACADALEKLSDTLGDDHDLEVLREALLAHPDLDPEARRELLARADARSCELRMAAWIAGQRLYAERPGRYVARIHRYWDAWRGDERLAADLRHVADQQLAAVRPGPDPEVICPGDQTTPKGPSSAT